MTLPLVSVQDLSKKFCRDLRRSLWYGVKDLGSELINRGRDHDSLRKDEFWAVREATFQLERGETLGLIGSNGAGKTTLLRMLNGLIKPDSGRIEIRGRMQALIALGAGFNPVLTGRENIFINASILGISQSEIKRRYDEIVDFSGIKEFIDMPVQSYSSGMTVRLGFSIAAHLEPDILLVDEVLAVGDLAFRTKCQVRIQELREKGVGIILVSHNLHTVSHICSRAITLERGQIIYDGDTGRAIDVYRATLIKQNIDSNYDLHAGTGEIRVIKVELMDNDDQLKDEFEVSDFLKIRIYYRATEPVDNPVFNIAVHVLNSFDVTGLRTDVDELTLGTILGDGYIDVIVPNLYLLPNIYTLDAVLFHEDGYTFYDRVNNISQIKVNGGLLINGTSYLPHSWILHKKDELILDKTLVRRDL